MCRSILLSSILLLAACGCSTTEEQPQAIPLDHVPSTVPSPSAAEVSLLPGYHAQVVVSLLNYPSSITFDPMGNLYVAESGAAPGDESRPPRILRIAPAGQIDIMSDKVHTPVKQIEWHDGLLYVWHGEKFCTVDHEGQVRDEKLPAPRLRRAEQYISEANDFGRGGQGFRLNPPTPDHGGHEILLDPQSRRRSVFFSARINEQEPSLCAGPG